MKTSAIHLLTCVKSCTFAALALGCGALPAYAQEDVTDTTPSVRDVALTPLSDLNLSKDPIPDALLRARSAPYDDEGISSCSDVLREVGDLDAVLGDDADTGPPDERGLTVTGVAQRVVGMFIPFRGIIREVSGANQHEFEFREAIVAGMMRRAFLKGRGQAMGCPYPASPAPPELVERLRRLEETPGVPDEGIEETADDGPAFVSQPVIQPTD